MITFQLSKRRNVQQTDTSDDDLALDLSGGGAGMISEVSSTTGISTSVVHPDLLHALYHDSIEIQLQATEKFRKLLSKGLWRENVYVVLV